MFMAENLAIAIVLITINKVIYKYMQDKSYFLCSEYVVECFPSLIKSKPFKSGFEYDNECNYYVIILTDNEYKEIEDYYNGKVDDCDVDNFWLKEITPGTMDVKGITLKGIREHGLFMEIANILDLTTEKNQALSIFNLSEKYNCTPIEFINKIAKIKYKKTINGAYRYYESIEKYKDRLKLRDEFESSFSLEYVESDREIKFYKWLRDTKL